MANPEIESELDGIDRVSVCLYRLGLSLAALLLLCRGASLLLGQDFWRRRAGWWRWPWPAGYAGYACMS